MNILDKTGNIVHVINSANLHGAHLNGANLNGTNRNGADLYGADLRKANLNDTNLNGAIISYRRKAVRISFIAHNHNPKESK